MNDTTHGSKAPSRKRDWRRIHHSPLFWFGVVLFLAAAMTYVLSDDLSWRPRAVEPAPTSRAP
jgi:hypothetical protein